jgi:hypothetical protein
MFLQAVPEILAMLILMGNKLLMNVALLWL